jgi:Protein of unknown function (DUF3568)
MKRWVRAMMLLSVLVGCGGCVAAAVGAAAGAGAGVGTYSYIKGELEATYSVPIEEVWPHTVAALEGLQLHIDNKQMDSLGGRVEARRADGTPVMVRLKPVGERSTTVGVRVGTFGSQKKSQRIHDAIQKQLSGSA